MTVTTTNSRDVKQGDGTTTNFPTSYQFFREDELEVTLVLDDGTFQDQTLNSDYTVTGGDGSPGTVKMTTAPAADEQLIIERQTFRVQNLDLVANDFLPAEALEDVADRIVLIVQELEDVVQRAPRIRPDFTGTSPIISDPDAGKLLTWDVNGNLVNTDIGEIDTNNVVVTSFGEDLVGQAGAQGARQLLDLDDHTLNDVDASLLGGQTPTYYTNINARLGYTAADKAGDTFTGPIAVENGSGDVFLRARPATTQASNNQAVFLGQSNAGLATVTANAGSDGLGDLVLQSASVPQHDDGSQLRRLLTTDDREGWRSISGGDIPSANASFDVALPSGYRRFRLIIFEGELNASEHPRALLSDDGGSTFYNDGSVGNEDYKTQFSSFQSGSDNHSSAQQGFAPLTAFNDRNGVGTGIGSTFDSFVDILNARRSDKHTRVYARSLYLEDNNGDPSDHLIHSTLQSTTNAIDTIRLVAGGSTSWADGTWELWGIPT